MRRREFFAGVAAAAFLPIAVRAQRTETVRRVAILVAETIVDDPFYERRVAGVRDGLRDLGWIEGQNLRLNIYRTAPKAADIRKQVNELLAGQPDVVVTSGGTTTGPLLQATNTGPVVFVSAIDPMGAGYVESLAHPGGNATGFMQFDYSLSGKWLEVLKQISPKVIRAGVIRDATMTSGIGQFAVIQSVASSVGIDVIPIGARDDREIESGIGKIARSQNGGLIATIAASVNGYRDTIIKLAAQHGLPAVYGNRVWVDGGGLISCGPDLIASSRLAASYVDRILGHPDQPGAVCSCPDRYQW